MCSCGLLHLNEDRGLALVKNGNILHLDLEPGHCLRRQEGNEPFGKNEK